MAFVYLYMADNSDIIIVIYCIPLLQPSSPVVWCNGTESTSSVHLKNSKTQNNVCAHISLLLFGEWKGRVSRDLKLDVCCSLIYILQEFYFIKV